MTRSRLIVVVATALLAVYLLPLVVLQENSHVPVHDILDSTVPRLAFLNSRAASEFDGEAADAPFLLLNERPAGYSRYLSVISILWTVFRPFTAYLLNDILVHVLAFVGMLLFLRRLFRDRMKDSVDEALVAGVAVCWAVLPYYSLFGLSVAGQPLLLFAFLNILRRESKFWDYLIILLFPFHSSLVLSGVFLLAGFALFFVVNWVRNRKMHLRFLFATVLLAVSYLAFNHRLFFAFFGDAAHVSHRAEFALTQNSSVESIGVALANFVVGQYHAVSLHVLVLLIAVPLALIGGLRRKLNFRWMFALLGAALAISVWCGIWQSELTSFLPRAFQFDRFYFLQPIIWYVVFAICLLLVRGLDLGDYGKGKYLAGVLLALQFVFVMRGDAMIGNHRWLDDVSSIGRKLTGQPVTSMTYRRFFSEDLFQGIAEFIGRPQHSYRVVSLGIHPAVSQYNGFYTLDGYLPDYPLEYKHAFRTVIEKELDKSERWQKYFDTWGSRCYVFSSELGGYIYTKDKMARVYNLELNADALRAMDGEYVLSAVEIDNAEDNDLELLGIFERDDSPWRIFLYQVSAAPLPRAPRASVVAFRAASGPIEHRIYFDWLLQRLLPGYKLGEVYLAPVEEAIDEKEAFARYSHATMLGQLNYLGDEHVAWRGVGPDGVPVTVLFFVPEEEIRR